MITIPFMGSKRNYFKPLKSLIKEWGYTEIYEPFGGSAVLSVNLYNEGIIDKAYINDYDGLFDLYPTYLNIKDELVKDLLAHGFIKNKRRRLPEPQEKYLQSKIKNIDECYWGLFANNFVFSGRGTNNLKVTDFCYFVNDITTDKQRKYLSIVNKLNRDSLDFREYFKKYKGHYNKNSLIILDPPYLNSAQKQYGNIDYFRLSDTIDLLECAKDSGADFLWFNMIEKDTLKLLELFDLYPDYKLVKPIALNYSAEREDVMVLIKQFKG